MGNGLYGLCLQQGRPFLVFCRNGSADMKVETGQLCSVYTYLEEASLALPLHLTNFYRGFVQDCEFYYFYFCYTH